MIIKHQKEETVTRLKKAYSTISNAWQRSHFELGSPEENLMEFGAINYFNKYWKPYLDVMKYCEDYSSCGYKSNQPFFMANGTPDSFSFIHGYGCTFLTKDGVLYIIRVAEGDVLSSTGTVVIDINGPNKPNKYGRDVFFFNRYENNPYGIRPQGYTSSYSELNSDCSKTSYGRYCAAKIIKDSWQIKDDYPW